MRLLGQSAVKEQGAEGLQGRHRSVFLPSYSLLLFSSTQLALLGTRYRARLPEVRAHGVSVRVQTELTPGHSLLLTLHSPAVESRRAPLLVQSRLDQRRKNNSVTEDRQVFLSGFIALVLLFCACQELLSDSCDFSGENAGDFV